MVDFLLDTNETECWSSILLEKLHSAQLVKKFGIFRF
jgi:hypothetical protein